MSKTINNGTYRRDEATLEAEKILKAKGIERSEIIRQALIAEANKHQKSA